MSFQWYHDGTALPDATNQFLTLYQVQTNEAGSYTLLASNAFDRVSSAAMAFTVQPDPSVAPWLTYTNILAGQPVCLDAEVTGNVPLSYQWLKNGVPLSDDMHVSGANSATLCLSGVGNSDNGDYQLALVNGFGSFTGAVVHVSATPLIGWGDDTGQQLDFPPDTGDVVSLAVGDDHCLALRADGTLVAWGDNTYGQTTVPASATNIVAVAAGGAQSMALTGDGHVLAWGDNLNGLNNVPATATNIFAIATCFTHSLALRSDGVKCAWGTGYGISNYTATSSTIAISAAPYVSLTLNRAGQINEYRQNATTPFPSGNVYRAIAANGGQEMALASTGIGLGKSPFVDTQGGVGTISGPPWATNGAAIAVGYRHFGLLRGDGIPVLWGKNDYNLTNPPTLATNLVAFASGPYQLIGLLGSGRAALAQQLSTRTQLLGSAAAIVAMSIGNAPAAYQWRFNGADLPGATNAILLLSMLRWTNAGFYQPLISDAFGTVLGPATLLNIIPPTLRFDSSACAYDSFSNTFQMRLLGTSGTASSVIYASTNLTDWLPVLTNAPVQGILTLNLPISPGALRMFYRAAELYSN